ncbi:MAG: hypothetical protein ACE5GM_02275 [bacterium]
MNRTNKRTLYFILSGLLYIIILTSTISMAAQEGYQGHKDGYYWTSMGHVGRFHFTDGYTEALEVLDSQDCKLKALSVVKGLERNELIHGLDILYANYENKEIQLHVAFYIVSMRIRGAREEDIQRAILKARKDTGTIVEIYMPPSAKQRKQ